MEKISNSVELQIAISQLESRRVEEGKMLREEFRQVVDWFSPARIVKTVFTEIFKPSGIIKTILRATFGLSAGYLSNKIFRGFPGRLLKGVLSNVL